MVADAQATQQSRQLGNVAAFRENDIDDTVLPSLTAENLKDLGHWKVVVTTAPRARCDAGIASGGAKACACLLWRCLVTWSRPRSEPKLPPPDKLTVTVERIDGGKFRCTGATWSDARRWLL